MAEVHGMMLDDTRIEYGFEYAWLLYMGFIHLASTMNESRVLTYYCEPENREFNNDLFIVEEQRAGVRIQISVPDITYLVGVWMLAKVLFTFRRSSARCSNPSKGTTD